MNNNISHEINAVIKCHALQLKNTQLKFDERHTQSSKHSLNKFVVFFLMLNHRFPTLSQMCRQKVKLLRHAVAKTLSLNSWPLLFAVFLCAILLICDPLISTLGFEVF